MVDVEFKNPDFGQPIVPSLGRGGPSREIAEAMEKRNSRAGLSDGSLQVRAPFGGTMQERVGATDTRLAQGVRRMFTC